MCFCLCHHRQSPSRPRVSFTCRRHRLCYGVLPYPMRAAQALQNPPLRRQRNVTHHAPSQMSATHGPDSVAIIDPAASAPSTPGTPVPPTTVIYSAVFGPHLHSDEPQLHAPRHLLLFMASDPAGPLVPPLGDPTPRCESCGRGHLRPSSRPLLLPPRLS